jgi:diguanylate cyclase (GGDEF)-like protein
VQRDELTGLPSRDLLREHLALAVARAREEEREVALLHVGLDRFQLVNQSLGREAGDAALREIGRRLDELTGPTQVVARAGSDQFCVLVPDLRRDAEGTAELVARAIAAQVQEPFAVDGADFELSASVGVSVFPADASEDDMLLRHAEAAMHDAKSLGAGSIAFYAGGTQDAYERLILPLRLRGALERHEFLLQYQPIFSLADGSVACVEALIRCRDPERGLIPPLDFLPVAEYTGLIEPIGEWVVSAACKDAKKWIDAGKRIPFSFNASLRQFRQENFAEQVTREVERCGLDPADVIVEITESTAMQEPRCVEPVLDELRAAGLRIAIDDFGTGYSSLVRLRELPVDIVKLDRMLLARAPEDDAAARLVSAAIELVRSLGMLAVAEGVEREEQRMFLVERGCPWAQGYHLARPADAERIPALA